MKIEILKGCIFILIGAYLCSRFMPTPKPDTIIQVKEIEKKSGNITRKIIEKPDGTKQIDEVESYQSNRSSDVSIIQKTPDKKNMLAIIPKYNFKSNISDFAAAYSYNGLGLYGSKSEIGLVFSLSW